MKLKEPNYIEAIYNLIATIGVIVSIGCFVYLLMIK